MQRTEQKKHKLALSLNSGVIVIFVLVTLIFLLALKTSNYSKAVFSNPSGQALTKTMGN
ncbi:MAG: hypothetical protein R6U66_02790 [Bacteroidales bacterium]|jgi:hypothetical protein